MSNEHLLCKDCKHSFRATLGAYFLGSYGYRCRLAWIPETVKENRVTGPTKEEAYYSRCEVERQSVGLRNEHCGRDAVHWTPRRPRDLFKLMQKEV
jgi:hypothetical protein